MVRASTAAALAAVLSLAVTISAPASTPTGSPDTQESTPPANSLNFQAATAMAQVFTPAHSGSLTDVTLWAGTSGSTPVTLYINIWNATSADPATARPSQSCAMDATNPRTSRFANQVLGTNTWRNYTLTQPVQVTANTPYAIVVCVPFANVFRWSWENVETYSGGKPYLWSNNAWMTPTGFKAFDFKAWLSATQSLSVAANSPAVNVDEGAAGANTGTFTNPFGYTVYLSASAGSVTKSGTSTGTWSWTASDEGSNQSILITADDAHGHTATASFTATVNAVKPKVQINGSSLLSAQSAGSPEGTPVQLTGTAQSPSAEDNAAGFSYSWKVTKDGADFAAGFGSSWSFTPDDEGTYLVTLTAADDGAANTVSTTVIGANVQPTAAITGLTGPAPWNLILPQEQLTFAGTFTDPGIRDTHTATWSFGDGSTASASFAASGSETFSATHSYVNPGSYPVSLTVTDDDGGSSTANWTVNVLTTQQALAAMAAQVQKLPNLTPGERNSLAVKLNAASASISRGDTIAADNQLNAFLHELSADVNTGKVSESDATLLRSAIRAIRNSLGTLSRFLGS